MIDSITEAQKSLYQAMDKYYRALYAGPSAESLTSLWADVERNVSALTQATRDEALSNGYDLGLADGSCKC